MNAMAAILAVGFLANMSVTAVSAKHLKKLAEGEKVADGGH